MALAQVTPKRAALGSRTAGYRWHR